MERSKKDEDGKKEQRSMRAEEEEEMWMRRKEGRIGRMRGRKGWIWRRGEELENVEEEKDGDEVL